MTLDRKRTLTHYRARRGVFDVLEVPPLTYLAVDGQGDPNTSASYAEALAALYPVAYALRFAGKARGHDETVMPLEALWWSDDMAAFTSARDKSRWSWTTLVLAPTWVDDAAFADAVATVARRKPELTGLDRVDLRVLPGEDEARLTFLAVRRWFGWSAGRLGVFDIGGGSLELAVGADEEPTVARSVPLGAGRLTRDWLDTGRTHEELRLHARSVIADVAGPLLRGGHFDRAVATSKTFRSLARMCGAASSSEGQYVRRVLRRSDLRPLISEIVHLDVEEIAQLPGVSHDRAHQMVAGAVVAEAAMDLFGVDELEICPWALREGVLLEHLAHL